VLYLLLLTQPLLGLLQTGARGQPVDFYFLIRLPNVIGIDRPLARQLHDLHALTANALLILIGLHAAAALFSPLHPPRRRAGGDAAGALAADAETDCTAGRIGASLAETNSERPGRWRP